MAKARRQMLDPEFGRLVFAKDVSFSADAMLIRTAVAGLVSLMGCFMILLTFTEKKSPNPLIMIPVGVAVICLPLVAWYFLVFRVRTSRFAFYERGLINETCQGLVRLAYDQCISFEFRATRVYVSRLYSHTDVQMIFYSADGSCVAYDSTDLDKNDDLREVRELVSGFIADRLSQQLATKHSVDWCERLRLTSTGVEVTPETFISKPIPFTVPYEQISKIEIREGTCFVYSNDSAKPVFEKPVMLTNFFPGLQLLSRLTPRRLEAE